MKSKAVQFLIISIFLMQNSYSQLSGYYTIGGAGADFQSLSEAKTTLYNQGVDSNVIFALNPGSYYGVTFTEIQGVSDTSTFTLQSSTLDSCDVIINGTIGFNEASYITINAISIISSNYSRSIDFFRSKHIVFNNCVINSTYIPDYDDADIKISHYWPGQGGFSNFSINNSVINSNAPSIYCTADEGETTINSCEINANGGLAIETSWSGIDNFNINNSTLNGGIDIRTESNSNLINNTINGKINIGRVNIVKNNHFISNEEFKISASYYIQNHFSNQNMTHSNPGTNSNAKFIENYFEGSIYISHATDIEMTGNTFHGDITLSFNQNLLFENNTMYGDLSYGATTGSYNNFNIQNNIFDGAYVYAHGHESRIRNNNFINDAYLNITYLSIMVFDNNFCLGIQGATTTENIINNNYFPFIYCPYDTNATYYDPLYLNDSSGIATNPILQGKAMFNAPYYDILGNVRKNPHAIGANEIFICDSVNNQIIIPCGEELYLNLCNIPDTGAFWWTPDTFISNPGLVYTSVIPVVNTIIYLHNSIYGLVDSVNIQVEPYSVEIAETPIFYCGEPRTLNTNYHPYANYHWTPEIGFNNPYINNPELLITDTNNLQYIVECQIDGCGISYDTLNIDYDPLPYVQINHPPNNPDTAFFTCNPTCVDEFFWDFGDDSYSSEENPFHVYQGNDLYTVTLTVTNPFGSYTDSMYYYIYWLSLKNIENEKITIFPNPAKGKVFLKGLPKDDIININIINLSGEIIYQSEINHNQAALDLHILDDGLYLIQIHYKESVITKKIVILKK